MQTPNFAERLASNRQDFINRADFITGSSKDEPKPLKEILATNKELMGEKARADVEAEQQKKQDLERQRREFKTLWDSTAEDRRKQIERLDAGREAEVARITAPGFKSKDSPLVQQLKNNPEIMARVRKGDL
jgi:hypothetical protein